MFFNIHAGMVIFFAVQSLPLYNMYFCRKKMLSYSDKPLNQTFHAEGVRHVMPANAREAFETNRVLAVDVRGAHEVMASSIDCPQLLLYPLEQLNELAVELPVSTPLILLCNHGIRSAQAVELLQQNGFTEVYNLDGGLHAWIEAGLPVAGSGGCSCGCH